MFSPHIPKRRRPPLFHFSEDYMALTEIDTSTGAQALLASDDASPKVDSRGSQGLRFIQGFIISANDQYLNVHFHQYSASLTAIWCQPIMPVHDAVPNSFVRW